jgi:DNA repair protein RecO (recombination protein O)
MLEKTRAIVLNQIKYSDSGIVAHLYTKKFGRLSVLIRGMRKKKAGKQNIMFQPMFILELELYYKPSREMQNLRELSLAWTPYEINSNIRKSTVAMFLGEVLTSVLREESPHDELFDYLENSIIFFDRCTGDYANFHIAFLAGLSSFLGIEPSGQDNPDNTFFDMRNGIFVPVPPLHGEYASGTVSQILASFFRSSFEMVQNIPLTGKLRNEALENIVRFYSLHLPSLKKINSLEILKEVFS